MCQDPIEAANRRLWWRSLFEVFTQTSQKFFPGTFPVTKNIFVCFVNSVLDGE